MAISELKSDNVTAKLWLPVEEVESSALTQLRETASLPWAFHVAVMPDCHWGNGATVGSVIALKNAISPAAVGVDLACGMAAVHTNLKAKDLPDNLSAIRHSIERSIPVGFNKHKNPKVTEMFRHGEYKKLKDRVLGGFKNITERFQDLEKTMLLQCGTLGGGNHFIELCLDQTEDVWLMLHSGSRNIGRTLAEFHINIAKKLTHNARLPNRDLSVFLEGTPEMDSYSRDLFWAQDYAYLNRLTMLQLYFNCLNYYFPNIQELERIVCHHNYVSRENHFENDLLVTRKGAISAKKGEMGIIPGSMGSRSYIVRGLGNSESLHSASHGAGRRMSRGQAKKVFTEKDLIHQTTGVECRKDSGVIDEIPGAYKDIEKVIEYQKDLVEVVFELKQILCVKG